MKIWEAYEYFCIHKCVVFSIYVHIYDYGVCACTLNHLNMYSMMCSFSFSKAQVCQQYDIDVWGPRWLMTGILDQFSWRVHFSSSRKFNSLAVARSCRSFCHSLAVDLPWQNKSIQILAPRRKHPKALDRRAVVQLRFCNPTGKYQTHQPARTREKFKTPMFGCHSPYHPYVFGESGLVATISGAYDKRWQKVVYLMCFMTMDGMGLLKTHGRVSGWGLIRRSWGETPMDQSMFDSKSRPCFSLMFFMFIDP